MLDDLTLASRRQNAPQPGAQADIETAHPLFTPSQREEKAQWEQSNAQAMTVAARNAELARRQQAQDQANQVKVQQQQVKGAQKERNAALQDYARRFSLPLYRDPYGEYQVDPGQFEQQREAARAKRRSELTKQFDEQDNLEETKRKTLLEPVDSELRTLNAERRKPLTGWTVEDVRKADKTAKEKREALVASGIDPDKPLDPKQAGAWQASVNDYKESQRRAKDLLDRDTKLEELRQKREEIEHPTHNVYQTERFIGEHERKIGELTDQHNRAQEALGNLDLEHQTRMGQLDESYNQALLRGVTPDAHARLEDTYRRSKSAMEIEWLQKRAQREDEADTLRVHVDRLTKKRSILEAQRDALLNQPEPTAAQAQPTAATGPVNAEGSAQAVPAAPAPAQPAVKAALTTEQIKAASERLTPLEEERAKLTKERDAELKRLFTGVHQGTIAPEDAQAQQDALTARLAKEHSEGGRVDSAFQAVTRKALEDRKAGSIDDDTLNHIFEKAGASEKGTDLFARSQKEGVPSQEPLKGPRQVELGRLAGHLIAQMSEGYRKNPLYQPTEDTKVVEWSRSLQKLPESERKFVIDKIAQSPKAKQYGAIPQFAVQVLRGAAGNIGKMAMGIDQFRSVLNPKDEKTKQLVEDWRQALNLDEAFTQGPGRLNMDELPENPTWLDHFKRSPSALAGMIGYMTTFATKAGRVGNVAAFASDSFKDLDAIEKRAGRPMNAAIKASIAFVTGTTNVLIEELGGVFGKLNPVQKAFNIGALKKASQRFFVRALASGFEESVEEVGQQISGRAIEDLFRATGFDVPEREKAGLSGYMADLEPLAKSAPEWVPPMVFLGAFAAGVHQLQSGKARQQESTIAKQLGALGEGLASFDADALVAVGIDPRSANRILSLNDPVSRIQAFEGAFRRRNPKQQATIDLIRRTAEARVAAQQPSHTEAAIIRTQADLSGLESGTPESVAQQATAILRRNDPATPPMAPKTVAAAQAFLGKPITEAGPLTELRDSALMSGHLVSTATPENAPALESGHAKDLERLTTAAAQLPATLAQLSSEAHDGVAQAEAALSEAQAFANEQAMATPDPMQPADENAKARQESAQKAVEIAAEKVNAARRNFAIAQIWAGVAADKVTYPEALAPDKTGLGEVVKPAKREGAKDVPVISDWAMNQAKAALTTLGAAKTASATEMLAVAQTVPVKVQIAAAQKAAAEAAMAARGKQAYTTAAKSLQEREQKGLKAGPQESPRPQEEVMSRESAKFPSNIAAEDHYKRRLKDLAPLVKSRFSATDVAELEAMNLSLKGQGSPMAITRGGGLIVDWERVRNMSPEEVAETARHEFKHLAQLIALTPQEVTMVWDKLGESKEGQEFQRTSRRAYRISRVTHLEGKIEKANKAGDKKAAAAAAQELENILAGVGENAYNAAMESNLLLINDPAYQSELLGIAKRGGFLDTVVEFLRTIRKKLRGLLYRLAKTGNKNKELALEISDQVKRVEKVLAELDKGEADFSGLDPEDVGVLLSAPGQQRVIRKPDGNPYETERKAAAAAGYYKLGKKADGAWNLREVHEEGHFKGFEIMVGKSADVSAVATPESKPRPLKGSGRKRVIEGKPGSFNPIPPPLSAPESGFDGEESSAQSGGVLSANEGASGKTAPAGKKSGPVAFAPEMGSLGVPRDSMPQVPSDSRGALTNFLKARGVAMTEERVAGRSLKPTQAEFIPEKVREAKKRMSGTQRKLLVSADGYLLDGHHQWMAARFGEVDIIRLGLPVREALSALEAFPSTKDSKATPASEIVLSGNEGPLANSEEPGNVHPWQATSSESPRPQTPTRSLPPNSSGSPFSPIVPQVAEPERARDDRFQAKSSADAEALAADIDAVVAGMRLIQGFIPERAFAKPDTLFRAADAPRGASLKLADGSKVFGGESVWVNGAREIVVGVPEDFDARATPQDIAAVAVNLLETPRITVINKAIEARMKDAIPVSMSVSLPKPSGTGFERWLYVRDSNTEKWMRGKVTGSEMVWKAAARPEPIGKDVQIQLDNGLEVWLPNLDQSAATVSASQKVIGSVIGGHPLGLRPQELTRARVALMQRYLFEPEFAQQEPAIAAAITRALTMEVEKKAKAPALTLEEQRQADLMQRYEQAQQEVAKAFDDFERARWAMDDAAPGSAWGDAWRKWVAASLPLSRAYQRQFQSAVDAGLMSPKKAKAQFEKTLAAISTFKPGIGSVLSAPERAISPQEDLANTRNSSNLPHADERGSTVQPSPGLSFAGASAEELERRAKAGALQPESARPLSWGPLRPYAEDSSIAEIDEGERGLIDWASQNGRLLTKEDLEAIHTADPNPGGGTEHDVRFVGDSVIRNTILDSFGFRHRSPQQYVQRWADYNRAFPKTPVKLLGVSRNQRGNAVIWTIQPYVEGKDFIGREDEMRDLLRKAGWRKIKADETYRHGRTGVVIGDVHGGNVLQRGRNLYPIDVIVEDLGTLGQSQPLAANEGGQALMAPQSAIAPEKLNAKLPVGTKRRDMWDLAASGFGNAEIAEAMKVSETAVASTLYRVRQALGVEGWRGPRNLAPDESGLSPRMRKVLDLFQTGQRPAEIARQLGISNGSVKDALKAIRRRLGDEIAPREKRGRPTVTDWTKVDWTQSDTEIAAQTGVIPASVMKQRQKLSPSTRRGPGKMAVLNRTVPPGTQRRKILDRWRQGASASEIADEIAATESDVESEIDGLREALGEIEVPRYGAKDRMAALKRMGVSVETQRAALAWWERNIPLPETARAELGEAFRRSQGQGQALSAPESAVSPEDSARHAELEAKHDAGTISPEETAEAQRLVDEAAKAAGYDVGPLYHRGAKWTVADPLHYRESIGIHLGTARQSGDMGSIREGKETKRLFMTAQNPLRLLDRGIWDFDIIAPQLERAGISVSDSIKEERFRYKERWGGNSEGYTSWSNATLRNLITEAGYDSVVYLNESEGVNHDSMSRDKRLPPPAIRTREDWTQEIARDYGAEDSYIALSPNQIKSAEPFTGVPLAQRFDPQSNSILRAPESPINPEDAFDRPASDEELRALSDLGSKRRAIADDLEESLKDASLQPFSNGLFLGGEGKDTAGREALFAPQSPVSDEFQAAADRKDVEGIQRLGTRHSDLPVTEWRVGDVLLDTEAGPNRNHVFQIQAIEEANPAVRLAGGAWVTFTNGTATKFTFNPRYDIYRSPASETRDGLPLEGTGRGLRPLPISYGPQDYRASLMAPQSPIVTDGFYSQLERVIADKLPNNATAAQAKGLAQKNAKPDEVKWSGVLPAIDRLASENGGKIPKAALLDYLRDEGAVRFQEVSKGKREADMAAYQNIRAQLATRHPEWMYEPGWTDEQIDAYDRKILTGPEYFQWKAAKQRFMNGPMDETRFAQYQLTGGRNYREVVLAMKPIVEFYHTGNTHVLRPHETQDFNADSRERFWFVKTPDQLFQIPKKNHATPQAAMDYVLSEKQPKPKADKNFTSSHFSNVPNYVAHMRSNEREDSRGQTGLFLEEVQSDRHQKGREQGYRGEYQIVQDGAEWVIKGMRGETLWTGYKSKEAAETDAAEYAKRGNMLGIPDAPYRTSWPLQMFKRALRDAVQSGKDWVGWTTGETQADRYDLSKQVSRVIYNDKPGSEPVLYADDLNGNRVMSERGVSEEKLVDFIGKEAARKLLEAPRNDNNERVLTGLDLQVGGEGMKGFYDDIMTKEVGHYVKQWGAKVEEGSLVTGEKSVAVDDTPASDPRKQYRMVDIEVPIWRVDITPAMRESVAQGQSLFAPQSPVSAEEDARYLELARDPEGNRAELQRMVDAAARKAGYRHGPAFHGTGSPWDEADFGKGKRPGDIRALYFTDDRELADEYSRTRPGPKGMELIATEDGAREFLDDLARRFGFEVISESNPREVDLWYRQLNERNFDAKFTPEEYRKAEQALNVLDDIHNYQPWNDGSPRVVSGYFRAQNPIEVDYGNLPGVAANLGIAKLIDKGHDLVVARNVKDPSYEGGNDRSSTIYAVAGSPSQIKSADPVTHDSAGAVIPLSQRFNPASDSILQAPPAPGSGGNTRGNLTPDPDFEAFLRELGVDIEDLMEAIEAMHMSGVHPEVEQILARPQPVNPKGRPDLANVGASAAARRGVNALDSLRDPGVKSDVERLKGAQKLLEDPQALVDRVMDASLRGDILNDEETFAAMGLASTMWEKAVRGGTEADLRKAALLTWAYRDTRTTIGRAFRAGQDWFATPAARNKAALTQFMSTLSPEDEVKVEQLPLKERRGKVDDLLAEKLKKIQQALAAFGITIEDVIDGDAVAKFRQSTVVNNAVKAATANTVERQALRFIMEGRSDAAISRVTGLDEAKIRAIEAKFRTVYVEQLAALSARGVEIGDLHFLANMDQTLREVTSLGDAGNVLNAPRAAFQFQGREINTKGDAAAFEKEAKRQLDLLLPTRASRTSGRAQRVRQHISQSGFDLANHDTAMALATIIHGTEGRPGDAVYELWINSILSGLQTHVVNISGNLLNTAGEYLIQRPIEVAVNRIIQDPNSAQPGEGKWLLKGLARGFGEAWAKAARAFSYEYNVFEAEKLDEPVDIRPLLEKGGGRQAIGERAVLQFLGGQGFKKYTEARAKYLRDAFESIHEEADMAGKKGQAAEDWVAAELTRRRPQLEAAAEAAGMKMLDKSVAAKLQKVVDENPALRFLLNGRTVRIPGRALLFMDTFFKHMVGTMEVGAQAYRIAKAKGLSGDALARDIAQQIATPGSLAWVRAVQFGRYITFNTSVSTGISKSEERKLRYRYEKAAKIAGLTGDAMEARVQELMESETQSERFPGLVEIVGAMATNAKSAQIRAHNASARAVLKILQGLLKLHVPFIATPYNLASAGFRRTPLGLLGITERAIKAGFYSRDKGVPYIEGYGKAMVVRDLADQMIAWSSVALLAGLFRAFEGDDDDDKKAILLTGSTPFVGTNKGKREFVERKHGGAMMLRIGREGPNAWRIPYRRLDPLATSLSALADAVRIWKQNHNLEPLDQLKSTLLTNLSLASQQGQDKTYLSGLTEMVKVYDSFRSVGTGDDDAQNVAEATGKHVLRIVSGIIPNLIRQPLRELEDSVVETKDRSLLYEFLPLPRAAVKGLQDFGVPLPDAPPAKVNLFGDEMKKQYSGGLQRVIRTLWASSLEPSTSRNAVESFLDKFFKQYATMPDGARVPSRTRAYHFKDINSTEPQQWVEMTPEQISEFDRRVGKRFAVEAMVTDEKGKRVLSPSDIASPTPEKMSELSYLLTKLRGQVKKEMFPSQKAWDALKPEQRKTILKAKLKNPAP